MLRQPLGRALRSAVSAAAAMTPACCLQPQRRSIHERPFDDLPEDLSKGEAYEVARDALLQLNLMVRRGIEPDALMYTSLIQTMAKAGLEWQAYKLFSRMIEMDIRPLPETYVALLRATSPSRRSLRADIEAKIENMVEELPGQLAETETRRLLEEDRKCVAKFEDYVRGILPPLSDPAPAATTAQTEAAATSAPASSSTAAADKSGTAAAPATATMHIRNPRDAWNTAEMAQELRARGGMSPESAAELRAALERMHEEELRIFLSAQRQMRHGDKAALVARVLEAVPERATRDMLSRRAHYFRSVESLLAADLRELRMSGGGAEPPASTKAASAAPPTVTDGTLSAREREGAAPEVLYAPWGILRKPRTNGGGAARPAAALSEAAAARLEQVRLTAPELALLRHKAEVGDLDEVPESLLRRYAHQFRLRWRRRQPSSLLDAVQWHALSFLPPATKLEGGEGELTAPPPTPPLRQLKEREGMQQTLENFEAFRVISQATNNLQVVDHREINLSLKRAQQEALRRDRRQAEALRREENVMAAQSLAQRATQLPQHSFVGGGADADAAVEGPTHVLLGNDAGETTQPPQLGDGLVPTAESAEEVEDTPRSPPEELPPWELFSGEDEFDLSTGRFGSPDVGRYRELNDSRFAVLPNRAAQKEWTVDRELLPSALRDGVRAAELEARRRHESIEEEYQGKLRYKKYEKWDRLIARARDKSRAASEQEEAEAEGAVVKPLPPRRRMAQLLRKNREKEKISKALREKYNRSL